MLSLVVFPVCAAAVLWQGPGGTHEALVSTPETSLLPTGARSDRSKAATPAATGFG